MPSSSGNTWPRAVGCDGEKSRHTRPVIAPFEDAGTSAGVAWFACNVAGLMPVSPSSMVPPAVTVDLLWSVPPGPDSTPVAASPPTLSPALVSTGYRPGGLTALATPCTAAFTTPVCGSLKKIDAQVRPAAVALNTSGMNTIVLNAVPQRIRSVSTANTSPKNVTRKGKTTTQTTLFL